MPYTSFNPAGCRVLVLAPHPDDETFGCGGTLALHTAAGDQVRVIFLTDGRRGDFSGRYEAEPYRRLRQREASAAAGVLGIDDIRFWPFADRRLADCSAEAGMRLMAELDEYQPQRIYVPSILEYHPDHRAAARLLTGVLARLGPTLEVAFYEVNQPLCINTLVDITPVLEIKRRAMDIYVSQLRELPYHEYMLALNRFRAITLPSASTHAEGYSMWPAASICRWLTGQNAADNRRLTALPGSTGMHERQLPFIEFWYSDSR
ncbi:MAG: PIG-L family deacetylase [Deltaproteobacteria bacterium]|nr:PIG-L family deacetylase [Candidatus Anaeroferrophillacea bacterium]